METGLGAASNDYKDQQALEPDTELLIRVENVLISVGEFAGAHPRQKMN